ncbi:MAG: hypothetical protein E6J91_39960 [Deltaproteobacteria bacterium]|nr:MAG: hypothetical protein E6J91_39960 [Deltaproteobacteria bacterium]
MWSRALCAAIACGCYNPSPLEGLACSETDRCPGGQSCDAVFHQCVSSPLCRPPPIADAFDSKLPPCQTWGAQFGRAQVELQDGMLAITPLGDGQNSGGCQSSDPIAFEGDGIFVEVPQVLPPGHGFVLLSAQGGSNAPTLGVEDDRLTLRIPARSIASAPYDPVAMRWWRLRPDRAAGATIAEYAADGVHWKQLGIVDLEREPQINIQLIVGIDTVDPRPATAHLDRLDVCPMQR